MCRDYFIIMVYCLVCEHYRAVTAQHILRRRGFPPALTDEEVMTIEICGEYFGLSQDEDIYDYFRSHYGHFFPKLRERTSFVPYPAKTPSEYVFLERFKLVSEQGKIMPHPN